MHRVYVLLLGSACVVGTAFAFLRSLTGPQFIPPAAGRSAVSGSAALPIELSPASPGDSLSPLDEYQANLIESENYLRTVDAYSATFIRQVRKDEELLDREEISVRIRHQPFSVYMNWDDDSQQVLYVDGENDGKLLAKRSRGFFRRTIRLGPTSRLAMADSRYPIYDLGMLNIVLKAREELAAIPSLDGVECTVESTELDGVPVRQFNITFASPEVQDTFSHCVICFSDEESMPVAVTGYGWTADGQIGELLEHYYYRDVQLDPGLSDLDFDAETCGF